METELQEPQKKGLIELFFIHLQLVFINEIIDELSGVWNQECPHLLWQYV